MKIAVLAANGGAGRLIVAEAVSRGMEVVAFGRSQDNQTQAQTYVAKDIFDLTAEDLAGFDAVVSAFGTFAPETLHLHTAVINHLSDLLAGSQTRLLIVGGAGSLYVNPEKTLQLVDTPDFPEEFRPLAKAQTQALAVLRERNDTNWTFISPAAEFELEAERTGDYILAGEIFTLNDKGESFLSYADYAIALVDELEQAKHIKERISVLGN